MIASKQYQVALPDVRAAVAHLHRVTQPNGVALDPDAPDILEQLMEYGYLPYIEPTVGHYQRKGAIVDCEGGLTHEVVDWPAEEITAYLTGIAQQHLDEVARTRNYDGILSLCSYEGSKHSTFGPEGIAGVVFRDKVWDYCYQLQTDIQAGNAQIPAPDAFRASLPPMVWPDSMKTYFSDGVLTAEEDAAGLVTEPTLWGRIKGFFGG